MPSTRSGSDDDVRTVMWETSGCEPAASARPPPGIAGLGVGAITEAPIIRRSMKHVDVGFTDKGGCDEIDSGRDGESELVGC